MQILCLYILSRFIHVTLCHTSNFRSIWYNLIYRDTHPETDKIYNNVSQGLKNYSNSSTVGFEPQTYCMMVWQPNYYTKIARPTMHDFLDFHYSCFHYYFYYFYYFYYSTNLQNRKDDQYKYYFLDNSEIVDREDINYL